MTSETDVQGGRARPELSAGHRAHGCTFLSGTIRKETRPAGQTCVPAQTSGVRDEACRRALETETEPGEPRCPLARGPRLRPGPTTEKNFRAPGSGAAASSQSAPGLDQEENSAHLEGQTGHLGAWARNGGFWKNEPSRRHRHRRPDGRHAS